MHNPSKYVTEFTVSSHGTVCDAVPERCSLPRQVGLSVLGGLGSSGPLWGGLVLILVAWWCSGAIANLWGIGCGVVLVLGA